MKRQYTVDDLPEHPFDPWDNKEIISLHQQWWKLRIARQQEIDASIAAKADPEYLYDKPYEDRKKVRVAGPFTVESLSFGKPSSGRIAVKVINHLGDEVMKVFSV